MLALRQRSPRLRHHAVCLHIVDALLLNEEGVLFHLIHSRDDLYIFAQVGQNGRVEVGYADGFRQSVLAGFLNATIHSKIIAHRLMQQNQINRDHIQLFREVFTASSAICSFFISWTQTLVLMNNSSRVVRLSVMARATPLPRAYRQPLCPADGSQS